MGVKDLELLGATGLDSTLQADRDVVVVEVVAIGFKVNPRNSLDSAVSLFAASHDTVGHHFESESSEARLR